MFINGFYIPDSRKNLIELIRKLENEFNNLNEITYSLKEYKTAKEVADFMRACAVVTKQKLSEVFLALHDNYQHEIDETHTAYSFEYLGFNSHRVARLLSAYKEITVTYDISDEGEEFHFGKKIKYDIIFGKNNEKDFLLYQNEEWFNERTLEYFESAVRDSD